MKYYKIYILYFSLKKYFPLVSFLCLITLAGCEKTINISPPAYQSKISIQCLLAPDSLPKLYLDKTVPYFDYKVLPREIFIDDAVVKIIAADGGVDILKPDSAYDAFACRYNYFYKGAKPTIINAAYKLEVTTAGQTFRASTSTNLPKVNIDSVAYTPTFNDIFGEHEGIIVYFKDVAGPNNFYRYQMSRFVDSSVVGANARLKSLCLGGDSTWYTEIGRTAFDDIGLDGRQIKIVVEPGLTHKAGVRGIIRIQTLDAYAAAFYNNLDNQKAATFNPFSEPVSLKTQIEGCVGIFGALVLSPPVTFIYPE